MRSTPAIIVALSCLIGVGASFAETRVTSIPTPFEGKRAKAVTDAGGTVHLIFNKEGNVHYSHMDAGTEKFSNPLQVNTVDGCAAVGEIAVGRDGRVHVLYHGNIFFVRKRVKSLGRKVKAQDIKYTFYSRLNQAGDRFEEQRDMSGKVWGFDGGCAIAADENGHVYLFMGGTAKEGKEKDRHVFMRRSNDNGKTFSEPAPVDLDKGVCACCHLKAITTADGNLMFAYRYAEKNVNRNSVVMVSRDRGRTFTPTPLDVWKLFACPGSSYSLMNSGRDSFVSWRNEDEIYFRRMGSEASVVPAGKLLKRRAAALGSNQRGEVIVAWAEAKNFNQPHDLHWQVYDRDGNAVGEQGARKDAFQRWGNPAVYAERNGDFVVLY